MKCKTPNLKIQNFLWLNNQLENLSKQLEEFISSYGELKEQKSEQQLNKIEKNFLIMQNRLNLERKMN